MGALLPSSLHSREGRLQLRWRGGTGVLQAVTRGVLVSCGPGEGRGLRASHSLGALIIHGVVCTRGTPAARRSYRTCRRSWGQLQRTYQLRIDESKRTHSRPTRVAGTTGRFRTPVVVPVPRPTRRSGLLFRHPAQQPRPLRYPALHVCRVLDDGFESHWEEVSRKMKCDTGNRSSNLTVQVRRLFQLSHHGFWERRSEAGLKTGQGLNRSVRIIQKMLRNIGSRSTDLSMTYRRPSYSPRPPRHMEGAR